MTNTAGLHYVLSTTTRRKYNDMRNRLFIKFKTYNSISLYFIYMLIKFVYIYSSSILHEEKSLTFVSVSLLDFSRS